LTRESGLCMWPLPNAKESFLWRRRLAVTGRREPDTWGSTRPQPASRQRLLGTLVVLSLTRWNELLLDGFDLDDKLDVVLLFWD